MKPTTLIVFLFFMSIFCFSIPSMAQLNDYVINRSGDTIKCKIMKPFFVDYYVYNTGEKTKPIRITVRNFNWLYIADTNELERAIFVDMPSFRRFIFLKVLEKGEICLYQSQNKVGGPSTLYDTTTNWFVSKGTDTAKSVKTSSSQLFGHNKRRNVLEEMLKDKKAILDKFDSDDNFSFKAIRNIIHLYNTGQAFKED